MEKLQAADAQDPACTLDLTTTRLVSETAQLLGVPTTYRSVTNKNCGDRPQHGVLFSQVGITVGASTLAAEVEMIALDETAGVFNYYVIENSDEIHFMGNSFDMLRGPGPDGERRCAACHTGGGLIMKELDAPWVHWEGVVTTPGVEQVLGKHDELLGTPADGANLEGIVRGGNRRWNETRIASVRASGTVQELLRPLFCTVEINLGSAPGEDLGLPSSYLVSEELGQISLDIPAPDYQHLVNAHNQALEGLGRPDTIFPFVAPQRSNADMDYVALLIRDSIVNEALTRDVLMVDFTRPVFSDVRCDLLRFVPELPSNKRNTKNIRAGLLANLRAAARAPATPAAELLSNLENKTDDSVARLLAFEAACAVENQRQIEVAGRPVSSFLVSLLKVISLRRDLARQLDVIEFAETMPDDDLDVAQSMPGARLHPITCELVDRFVPIAGASPP
jgi:hypothetical protein